MIVVLGGCGDDGAAGRDAGAADAGEDAPAVDAGTLEDEPDCDPLVRPSPQSPQVVRSRVRWDWSA